MSTWTHVSAMFRVDSIQGLMPEPNWDDLFGRKCLFDDSDELWREMRDEPELFLPGGSEGTLDRSVWKNPDKSAMAAYCVTMFGDLRDVSSTNEVEEWFKRSCERIALLRQAVMFAEVEWGEAMMISCIQRFEDESGKISCDFKVERW